MGRFVKNKILLGCSGAATAACTGVGMAVEPKQNQQSINNQNYRNLTSNYYADTLAH